MLISWYGWPLPYSYMPAKGISVCPIPTLVEKRWVFSSFFGWGYVAHYIMQVPPGLNLQFFSAWGPKSGWSGTVKGCQTLLGWPGIFLWLKWQGNGRKKGHFREKKRKNGRNASKYWVPKNSFLWEYGNPKTFPFLEKNRVQVLMEASYEGLRAAGGVVRSI